jgi:GTP-binding protein
VADLVETGSHFVLCKGGKGGKGNMNFVTSTHQAPREFTPGTPGDEGSFHFELRSIAEAGLVGAPNAGKSTLLSKLSAAKPKIANYPFTTLQPMVGVIEFGPFRRGTLADIPGLIEGAHQNIGLGHDFLRHIMRCRVLLFVVDTAGTEGRDPVADLETVRAEVSLYSKELSKRPWCILANKCDLPEVRRTSRQSQRALQTRQNPSRPSPTPSREWCWRSSSWQRPLPSARCAGPLIISPRDLSRWR